MPKKRTIFVISASQDNELLLYLLPYLKPLEDELGVAIWHDDPMYPGQQWKPKKASRLHKSDIFLLLISNAFMHSEFIKQDEFKMVIDRYKAGKSMVIPVLLDDCQWDIDFESDDYNFNLRELHVIPQEGKPITDWNSADQVFMQLVDHLKQVITSFADKPDQMKSKEKTKRKRATGKRKEQITLNFGEEKGVDTIAQEEKGPNEEAETNKRIEEEHRLEEEKRLKEAAETERRTEQEAVRRGETRTKKRVEDENYDEITTYERASEQEKRQGEDVATQRRVNRKNRLTAYNYRFKSAKIVEAKKLANEEKWGNEKAKVKNEVALKSRVEIAKSESGTKLEKRQGEDVATQRRVLRKNRLSEYNYRFKSAKAVEAKAVTTEEKRKDEEAKAKKTVKEKSPVEIAKSEIGTNFEKRLGEVVAVLKSVLKKNPFAGHYYRFKSAKAVEAKEVTTEEKRENEEAKAKKTVKEKSRVEKVKSEIGTNFVKRLGELVEMLKSVLKKNPLAGHYYRFKSAKAVAAREVTTEEKRENIEAKAKRTVKEKSRVEIAKSEIGTNFEKRLGEVVAVLKSVLKKNPLAGHYYRFKSVGDAHQGPEKRKSTNEKKGIRAVFLIAAIIIGGLFIYIFTGDSEKKSTELPEIESTGVDAETVPETTIDAGEQEASFSKLAIGDTYGGGIIFALDPTGKTGKIAYPKDNGPMPWKNARNIHEQLGEGWRLPTLDELRILHRTIGQGATNSGQFDDALYWSATAYDEHQARLLRFSDGNTSYHYNKKVAHRKFLVRAVRDFDQ